ncbi:hypothetical protein LCGC14_0294800 [marine sediment metagenome]|uniref:Uncharacterized protein n=1 Tax=marine sediment metagenome TaxID=412755 RepID=A0A0F9U936_9ZZZZ
MQATIVRFGPWLIATACQNALCSDGRRRYVKITQEPDTFFSLPGSVKVSGRTVTGFVTGIEFLPEGERDYKFVAYAYGKNGHLLP